jgi:hypothetical protein
MQRICRHRHRAWHRESASHSCAQVIRSRSRCSPLFMRLPKAFETVPTPPCVPGARPQSNRHARSGGSTFTSLARAAHHRRFRTFGQTQTKILQARGRSELRLRTEPWRPTRTRRTDADNARRDHRHRAFGSRYCLRPQPLVRHARCGAMRARPTSPCRSLASALP